ncbi:Tn3 family transposase [Streptomyces chartreusis]|uniref:Tn3 family transposase n=1 Tax=Streptomyces chartreusis TaxID=1969 RepID=UPI003403C2AE
MVVWSTPRDSVYTPDTLLNLDCGVKPGMVATDNALYPTGPSAWGRPRPPGTVCWRPLPTAKMNHKRIATHWPDMLRAVAAAPPHQVRAYDGCACFGREGHPASLGAAFAEHGRIETTMHLLAVIDQGDDTCGQLMNRQLTVQGSRHRLARAICYGGRGQLRQAYHEGEEDQLAALGLALNAVVLWDPRYLDAAVAQLRAQGHDIKDEDVARHSRSRTGTSTSWAATSATSRTGRPARACGPCVTRTLSPRTPTTESTRDWQRSGWVGTCSGSEADAIP